MIQTSPHSEPLRRLALTLAANIFAPCVFLLLSALCATSQVTVVASSRGGDRLTKRAGAHWDNFKYFEGPIISVDPAIRYQTIAGFGATFNEAGMICLNSLDSGGRDRALVSLFDRVRGAGFSLMKSPIGACDFASAGGWYSYDDSVGDTAMAHFSIHRDLGPNGLISYIKAAQKFGKFQIESPMDFAPDWMYYGLAKGERHLRTECYPALANYYLSYLQAYRSKGIHIGFLNLFNEANNDWYSNESYAEIGKLIEGYVAPLLRARLPEVAIQFGETANRPEALEKFPSVLDDIAVRREVNSLTVHGYDWDGFATLTALHKRYDQLPIWMTEVCYARPGNIPTGRDTSLPVYGFDDGEYWGNMIVNDLNNWVCGWIYWNMILDENGGPWLVSVEHGDPDGNRQHPVVIVNRKTKEVHYTGLYYYLAHFSKFVRPGAVRIGSNVYRSSALNCVAFQRAGHIILNIINNGADTSVAVNYGGRQFIRRLAAHSVTTFAWKKFSHG